MKKKERILKALAVIVIVGIGFTANSIKKHPQFYSNLYSYSLNNVESETAQKSLYALPLKFIAKGIHYFSNF